jgi:hypothetical protein
VCQEEEDGLQEFQACTATSKVRNFEFLTSLNYFTFFLLPTSVLSANPQCIFNFDFRLLQLNVVRYDKFNVKNRVKIDVNQRVDLTQFLIPAAPDK